MLAVPPRLMACALFAFTALALSPASAQWLVQEKGSDFDDKPALHSASTMDESRKYALTLQCRGPDDLSVIFITPDKSISGADKFRAFNNHEPVLKIRVDDGPVLALSGRAQDSSKGLVFVAPAGRAPVDAIRGAKSRVSVALGMGENNFHERRFPAAGTVRAMDALIKGCGLETISSAEDVQRNTANLDDVASGLRRYYDRIYSDPICFSRSIDGRDLVFCRSKSGSVTAGGLYLVVNGENGLRLFAVNGTAKSHQRGGGGVVTGSSKIQAENYREIDIPITDVVKQLQRDGVIVP